MARVKGKVAIVTGAAMGIGAATAHMLAREGAAVVLTDIKDAEGEATAAAIRDAGGEALYLHHDVAEESEWIGVVDRAMERYGRLNVLVNNAGIGGGVRPEEETFENWRRTMSINLDGVFLGTKHALLAMKRSDPVNGSIINLSSIEGLVGDPRLGTYNATKGGVRLYTKSVALYCGREGLNIRVNSVHPGYVWTPMVENHLRSQGGDDAVEQGRKALEALHPIGRLGRPDEIAWGILYLASDESSFMTGAELVLDGGYTAQ